MRRWLRDTWYVYGPADPPQVLARTGRIAGWLLLVLLTIAAVAIAVQRLLGLPPEVMGELAPVVELADAGPPFVWPALAVAILGGFWILRLHRRSGGGGRIDRLERRVHAAEWLGAAASFVAALVAGASLWFLSLEQEDRRNARITRAWNVVSHTAPAAGRDGECSSEASGARGNVGQLDALRALHAEGVDLQRIGLSGHFLDGLDLRNAHLEGADFSCTRLRSADLSRTTLADADFSGSDAVRINLRGIKGKRLRLSAATLGSADLREADLFRPSFERADLTYARFTGARVLAADFSNATLRSSDFTEADLREGAFVSVSAPYARFKGANLTDATFAPRPPKQAGEIVFRVDKGQTTYGASYCLDKLAKARTRDPDLAEARYLSDLSGVDFSDATLSNANLCGARIGGADLRRADLSGGSLAGINTEFSHPTGTVDDLPVTLENEYDSGRVEISPFSKGALDALRRHALGPQSNVETERPERSTGDIVLGALSIFHTDFSDAVLANVDLTEADLRNSIGLTQGQIDTACADPRRPPQLPEGLRPPSRDCGAFMIYQMPFGRRP